MDILTAILTSLVILLGLASGIAIAYFTKEELKPGKVYFIFLQNFLLTLIVIFLLYFYELNKNLILIVSLLVFMALIKINTGKNYITYHAYLGLGFLLMLTFGNKGIFLIESILIFLYGLPTGTLIAMKLIER